MPIRQSLPGTLRAALSLSVVLCALTTLGLVALPGLRALLHLDAPAASVLAILLSANALLLAISWLLREFAPAPGLARAGVLFLSLFLLLAVAAFNLYLVGYLAFEFRLDRLWLVALLLPGLSAAWLLVSPMGSTAPSEEDAVKAQTGLPPASTGHAPETPSTILQSWGKTILYTCAYLTVFMMLYGTGSFAFRIVQASLFEDRVIEASRLAEAAGTTFVRLGFMAVFLSIGLGLLFALFGIGQAMANWAATRNPQRYNRPLLPQEEAYIRSATDATIAYAESERYPKVWGFIAPIGGFLVLMGSACLGWASAFVIASAVRARIALSGLPDIEPSLTSDIIGPGNILGLFLGIVIAWPSMQLAFGRFPRFSEHLYVRHGWNTMNSEPRTEAQYETGITRALRQDRLTITTSFNPRQYLRDAYREFEAFSVKALIGSLALLLTFGVLDGMAFRTFTPEAVIHSAYFDLSRHSIGYDEVEHVETTCYIGSQDDRPALSTRYELVMQDGRSFRLPKLTRRNLPAIEQIDARLRALGTPFSHGERGGIPASREPGIDPACIPWLERAFEDDADRARELLRVIPLTSAR
tara:strand:- start:913 stop:2664 length:1752 start_codon:yes stop_codon:yes gene_type:complete